MPKIKLQPTFDLAAPPTTAAHVLGVQCDSKHRFSKPAALAITLEAGHGVLGDAHAGATVQHRYQKRWRPQAANLRQVHVISASLLALAAQHGFALGPGQLGENITLSDTPGWQWHEMMRWPAGTTLHFAQGPVLTLTGWRQPCVLMERFAPGLRALLEPSADAPHNPDSPALPLPYRTGLMAVVHTGGPIHPGDAVQAQWPAAPLAHMGCV